MWGIAVSETILVIDDRIRGESVYQTAIESIRKLEIAFILLSDVTQKQLETNALLFGDSFAMLERRYMAHDEPVLKEPNNKPYYRQFEKRSKKQ